MRCALSPKSVAVQLTGVETIWGGREEISLVP